MGIDFERVGWFWQFFHHKHPARLACWASCEVSASELFEQLQGCFFLWNLDFLGWECWLEKFPTELKVLLFTSVSEEAEVADTHIGIWQDMEEESADELFGR